MLHSYYRRNLAAFERFEQGIGFSYWLLFDMEASAPERYSVAREHPRRSWTSCWTEARRRPQAIRPG